MTDRHPPDKIAHLLVTHVGSPVRIFLVDEEATIPTTPYRNRTGVETDTIPLSSLDAVIEQADIEDGGLTLASFSGIHVPESEWRRIGLEKHWHAEDVDLESPFTDPQRRLEVRASREHGLADLDNTSDLSYDHLDGIPDDSPLITEWADSAPDDSQARPHVPFERPTVSVYALCAEAARDPQGSDRIALGEIARVEVLDDLAELPEEPNIDTRTLDIDPTLPRHPEIEYTELEPLPHEDDVLQAVHTINRYAKQFGEQADTAYQTGQGAEARASSTRKRALYRTKTVAIHRLTKSDPDAVRMRRHELNGEYETYCFFLSPTDTDDGRAYSFHQPNDAVDDDLLEAVTGSDDPSTLPLESISFDAESETGSLDWSLDAAIEELRQHGLDPNDYLDTVVVEDYDWGYEISTIF